MLKPLPRKTQHFYQGRTTAGLLARPCGEGQANQAGRRHLWSPPRSCGPAPPRRHAGTTTVRTSSVSSVDVITGCQPSCGRRSQAVATADEMHGLTAPLLVVGYEAWNCVGGSRASQRWEAWSQGCHRNQLQRCSCKA